MTALLTILSIVIGLVFVLLLFSLLASTVMEILSKILSLRGKHLLVTLENMLGDKAADFRHHPFFRQLSYAGHRATQVSDYHLPEWIDRGTFRSVLLDVLDKRKGKNVAAQLEHLEDGDLKNLLQYLHRQSDGSPEDFEKKVEQWFDQVMERATEWYKRATKWWLFAIGLALAAIFNGDTIQIYKSLSVNATLREDFVRMAEKAVNTRDSVLFKGTASDGTLASSQAVFKELAGRYTETVESPLGLGWTDAQGGKDLPIGLVRLLGWILTGIAVTYGAPFWFETLKKLLALRSGKLDNAPPPAQDSTSSEKAKGKV